MKTEKGFDPLFWLLFKAKPTVGHITTIMITLGVW